MTQQEVLQKYATRKRKPTKLGPRSQIAYEHQKLLLALRCKNHIHLLAIELRHKLYTSILLKVVGEA